MEKAIYIAGTGAHSGKSVAAIGLMNALLGKAQKVAFYKPISGAGNGEHKDYHIETILSYFQLPLIYEDTYACSWDQALNQWESDAQGDLLDKVIRKYKELEEKHDFTVIEGSDYLGEGTAFEFEINVQIARNVQAAMILVTSGEEKTAEQVTATLLAALHNCKVRDVQVVAVIANKIAAGQTGPLTELLTAQLSPATMFTIIPENIELRSPTMQEILDKTQGKLLFGKKQLDNRADYFLIGAMHVPNFLNFLKKNTLIISPGDRGDIVLSALQANVSAAYPKVAGIVLTTGYQPESSIQKLISGLQTIFPIISTSRETFPTCLTVAAIRSRITPDNPQKIQLAIETFNSAFPATLLEKLLSAERPTGLTPRMFQYQLTEWAAKAKKHIILPEGNDERILRAAAKLIAADLVTITLFGHDKDIRAQVKQLGIGLNMDQVNVVDPASDPRFNDFANTLYELRKHKGMTPQMARDLIADSSYFATMMVYKGLADAMVSGALHTTLHTIKPALQFIKTKPGISLVSSVFFMCLPDRVCVFGDCAVNPDPTADQLADIAIASAESARHFGIEPRIAMLSYASGDSGEGEDVDKVRLATELVRQKRPDLKVEGPIQYDAAVDPEVARMKMPGSEVAGQASVFIFPDLNSGNTIYKAVQRETGAVAIGPILQGLKKPVNDLSRGCTVDDIFNTVIITAIQCQQSA